MNADSLTHLPCDNCDYCTKQEVRDQTLQIEDPHIGPSVRVLTGSQTTKCNDNTNSLTDKLIGFQQIMINSKRLRVRMRRSQLYINGWIRTDVQTGRTYHIFPQIF